MAPRALGAPSGNDASRTNLAGSEADAAGLASETVPALGQLLVDDDLAWVREVLSTANLMQASRERKLGAISQMLNFVRLPRVRLTALRARSRAGRCIRGRRRINTTAWRGSRHTARSCRDATTEATLTAEFAIPEISRALFGGGELLGIDLDDMSATRREPGGDEEHHRSRHSLSGEHAFAYSRARVARAAEMDVPHKVIALDEFGAYLARDRLDRLASFVDESGRRDRHRSGCPYPAARSGLWCPC